MRNLFLIILLFYVISGLAQVNAGLDQTICIDETTSLNGSGSPSFTFEWTSDPIDLTISDPTILNPTVQPSTPTTYTLEGRSVSFSNLVVDGSFESGTNNNFTSSYTYSPGPNGLWNEGTYAVTQDAGYNHNNFTCSNDHTTGSGYFMAVNGAQTPIVVVWSTSVNGISPNTEYEFSTWVASLSPANPAILQFRINGILLGEPFNASSITCEWFKFFEKWNSGSATSADISIVNQNTEPNGNDFSLDDINFSKVTYYYDECEVNVVPIPTSTFDMNSETCSSDTALVTYTGTASTTGIYDWNFDGGTIITDLGNESYLVKWSTPGIHQVSLSIDDICLSDTTTKSINVLQSPTSVLTADAIQIPFGTTTTLHGEMGGSPGPYSFTWDPGASLQNPTSQDPETVQLQNSTLFTFTTTDDGNLCSIPDTITIYVTGGPLTMLSVAATPDTICVGDTSILNVVAEGGSGNYTYTWTSDPPGFNQSGPESQIEVWPTETTTYDVDAFDGFNTTPISTIEVVVLPQIQVTEQPNDTMIEDGQTAIFSVTAINELTYQWEFSEDGGITWIPLNDDAPYSGTQTPVLTITGATENISTNLYHCLIEGKCSPVFSDVAELTVILSPDFIGELEDVEVCQADTIFVPFTIDNFIEIDSFDLIFTFDENLLQFTELINLHPELSSVSVVQSSNSITLNWSSTTGITINDGIFFEFGFIALEGGLDSVKWLPVSVVKNSFGYYPELQVSSAGINILALPVVPDDAIATPDSANILDEIDIDLEAIGGSGINLVWTQDSCYGDSIGTGSQISLFRPDQTTTYYAYWTNLCGISECKEVTVKITEKFSFAVPNAFTPNGDGLNDGFGIISPNTLPLFELNVFNRWGQLIFNSSDQYDMWDGTYNGELSPLGVYIWNTTYQYRIEGEGSEVHNESGTVTLIR